MIRPVTSASNLYRRALCPGSEKLEAGLPDDEDSEEAKIGTLLHQYDANPELDRAFLSQRNRELLKIAEICDEKVFARVREQFAIPSDEPPMRQSTEGETWWVGGIPGHTDRWAYFNSAPTPAATLLCRGILVIIDKKFGFKEVTPATSNYQLRTYACAGAEKFKTLGDCVVAITQPRLPYEQRITMAHYSIDDIAAAREEIFAIHEACAAADAPLVPGPEQCRYCKAKLICPAFKKEMSDGFAVVAVEGTLTKRKVDVGEIIKQCSDEDLDKIIQFVRQAKFVEEMAINEGRARVEAGKLTTYELGKPSQPRYIADPLKAYALLNLRHVLDSKAVWGACSMALGKIEDAVAQEKKFSMKEARKLVESVLGDAIQREERKPSLIRKS